MNKIREMCVLYAENTKNGDINHIISLLQDLGIDFNHTTLNNLGKEICEIAAKKGNINLLIAAHNNRCNWDIYTPYYAVINGHLPCLKYSCKNKCPLPNNICEMAAKAGNIDCLQYLVENNIPFDKNACIKIAIDEDTKMYLENPFLYNILVGDGLLL